MSTVQFKCGCYFHYSMFDDSPMGFGICMDHCDHPGLTDLPFRQIALQAALSRILGIESHTILS